MSSQTISQEEYVELLENDPPRSVVTLSEPSHPFWHVCRKCAGWAKIGAAFLALDVASEFITFMPIHRFFEWAGWIA